MEELVDSEADEPMEEGARNPGEVSTPAPNNPPREVRKRGPGPLRAIVLILVAVALVALLVLFARWLYHVTHHNAQTASTNTNTTSSQPSSELKKQSAKNSQSSSASSNSGLSASASTPAGSNNSLPNSGPGDVAAIFVSSSLAAAGLHYIVKIRRFNKTGI